MEWGDWWATVHRSQRVGHNWAHTHTLSFCIPKPGCLPRFKNLYFFFLDKLFHVPNIFPISEFTGHISLTSLPYPFIITVIKALVCFLFIFMAVLDLCCYAWAFKLSLVVMSWGYSLAVVHRLFSFSWLLLFQSRGSRCRASAVAHGLSCPMTYRIFLDQGLNLCPLHWQVDS